jgi:hypothetical protein
MLVLALLAGSASAVPQPSGPATPPASATVRIERAVSITERHWNQAPIASRREVERTDEKGRKIIVRLIEHQ